jgi:hypothetical protein
MSIYCSLTCVLYCSLEILEIIGAVLLSCPRRAIESIGLGAYSLALVVQQRAQD